MNGSHLGTVRFDGAQGSRSCTILGWLNKRLGEMSSEIVSRGLPKDHLTWKGLNLHSRGVLVLKIVSFEVSGSLGYGKLVDFFLGGGHQKLTLFFELFQ